ncbi:MAG: radical SAM protein [Candidatus Improbicoccus pseudotrichonymphae]|uniref:Radical SAM protein n=1 Tax=Candidatus Improbicoccus pseudotrichonymphae TaxID=3033792 RepID=A0AA48L0S2_9FIRM|nr:MAG: radical SAM protein [Candidatus Improbicoccus pseudotrichonymphae]
MIRIGKMNTNSCFTTSKLPGIDYVINPYVGCPHKCIYCYAEFMKRFTRHKEVWGDFLDVKIYNKSFNFDKLKETDNVLIGSVTDAYNFYESKYKNTQNILKNLVNCKASIEILTKSDLVLRDIELLKQLKKIRVGISMNTLDDNFRKLIEPRASSVEKRINTLEKLKAEKISVHLFMSPIFPHITNFKVIINRLKSVVDYFGFENLNLRAAYLPRVLNFIKSNFPDLSDSYRKIYISKDNSYWETLEKKIVKFCEENKVSYKMYFHHDKIKKR